MRELKTPIVVSQFDTYLVLPLPNPWKDHLYTSTSGPGLGSMHLPMDWEHCAMLRKDAKDVTLSLTQSKSTASCYRFDPGEKEMSENL